MARPALAPLVMPCKVDSGTAVGFVLGDTVADAASKEDDVEGPVGVACSTTTELELAREFEDDVAVDVAVDVTSELDIKD